MKAKIQILRDNEIKFITLDELLDEFEKLKQTSLQKTNDEEERLLTRVEVCDLLHISLPTIHTWSKSGRLKPIKIGARVLFKEKDIKQLIAA